MNTNVVSVGYRPFIVSICHQHKDRLDYLGLRLQDSLLLDIANSAVTAFAYILRVHRITEGTRVILGLRYELERLKKKETLV